MNYFVTLMQTSNSLELMIVCIDLDNLVDATVVRNVEIILGGDFRCDEAEQ